MKKTIIALALLMMAACSQESTTLEIADITDTKPACASQEIKSCGFFTIIEVN